MIAGRDCAAAASGSYASSDTNTLNMSRPKRFCSATLTLRLWYDVERNSLQLNKAGVPIEQRIRDASDGTVRVAH